MSRTERGRKGRGKPFSKGYDPRRHVLTTEERRRGGLTTARKYTCLGRWHLDWWDRCHTQKKGEY
ncbi:MAG TPA: hypothetical protein VEL76_02445 [Gemmataceae bacterium]|nr:hypothetical protein [Gemmataceae bacterium]